ncbi:MAG: beta-ketoacyl synthase chain length factor [Elusimicrobia bacterium]|jgi:hypothetical protein|nr:beta-ketoacyl synthase chain length factor [Elusimicrobiota bacterium]
MKRDTPSVFLRAWAGWIPGTFTKNEWNHLFHQPKISMEQSPDPVIHEIPSLMRRRMGRVSRMSTAVALVCCQEGAVSPKNVPLVFASRHGEMSVLMELLSQMAEGEPVSPTGFSHSVHHTSGSFFSMATGNERALRSVAGGSCSFGYGFLDALGLLREEGNEDVLFVVADDKVPTIFEPLVDEERIPYAIALLLSRASIGNGVRLSFELSSPENGTYRPPPVECFSGVNGLDFLRWLEGKEKSFELLVGGHLWHWSK